MGHRSNTPPYTTQATDVTDDCVPSAGCSHASAAADNINSPGTWTSSGSSFSCEPGSTILNVGLPSVTVPVTSSLKKAGSFQVVYGGLGLNFTVLAPSGNSICAAQSNVGSLNVSMQLGGVSVLQAQSTTSATLTVFPPATLGPLSTCNFGSGITITSGCILNGSFDSNADYVEWFSNGFTTTILGSSPKALSTGPLSFWVDADTLGLSPANSSMDAIVRGVEAYIHVQLINNLPLITPYAVIQDPGAVTGLVVNKDGLTIGVLPSGIQTDDIPGSSYLPSQTNPAVALPSFDPGSYEIVLSGLTSGSYQVDSITTNFVSPPSEDSSSGDIATNEVVGYTVELSNASSGPSTILHPTTILLGDMNGDGKVDCADLGVVAASYGASTGLQGFNAWADLDHSGVINIVDLEFVAQQLPRGLTCPALTILTKYVTYQSTLADINYSLQFGLITEARIGDRLSDKIERAAETVANGKPDEARRSLKEFSDELDRLTPKDIPPLARHVLLEEAKALDARLPNRHDDR
jgi:hypothetical protein